jgi:thioredoxin 1
MASKNVLSFDDANFESEVLGSDVPVLVDFHATWCGPCKVLAPIVEKLADEMAGKLKVGKLDVDQAPRTAAKYGITSVPTVMVFQGGQRKATHIGLAKREKLVELVGVS